jgi:hypothetical protein
MAKKIADSLKANPKLFASTALMITWTKVAASTIPVTLSR